MTKIKIIILSILGIILLGSYHKVLAFGISPAGIYNDRLMPGAKFEQSFTVSRSLEEKEDLIVLVEPDLGEIASWFSYEPSQSFDFPGNKSEVKLTIKVSVPPDAALKSYDGFIRVKATTKEKNTGVSIVKGVRMDVNLLTSNIVVSDLLVRAMRFADVKEGEPLSLTLTIENKGNVAVAPSKATVEVLNLNQEPIGTLTTDKADKVDANQTEDIVMDLPLTVALGKGEYFGVAKVYLGEKVLRQERLVFRVLEKTGEDMGGVEDGKTAKQKVTLNLGIKIGTYTVCYGLISLGIVLLILLALLPDKIKGKKRLVLVALAVVCLLTGGWCYLSKQKKTVTEVPQEKIDVPVSKKVDEPMVVTELATPSGTVKGAMVELREREVIEPVVISDSTGRPSYYVYEKADTSSRPIYAAREGESFKVISETSLFYNVVMEDGTSGWLPKAFVKDRETVEIP